MQAANEELADYLPQVPSAYLGGHSIPFTSLGASPTPDAMTAHSNKQELGNLLRMLSAHSGEVYGPSTTPHASSMGGSIATTTHTTVNVPSTTTQNWPLGTVTMTTPTSGAECRRHGTMMNNNISAALRKMVIAALVLLTILVVVAAGVGVLYCTYRCRNKYLDEDPFGLHLEYQVLSRKGQLYVLSPSSSSGVKSPELSGLSPVILVERCPSYPKNNNTRNGGKA